MDELSKTSLGVACRSTAKTTTLRNWPVVGPSGWKERAPKPFTMSEPEEDSPKPAFTFHLSECLSLGLRENLAQVPLEPIEPLPLETD